MATTKARTGQFTEPSKAAPRKPAPKRKSRVFSISFPEGMARQVERLAAEEDRSISEFFRELFRRQNLVISTGLFQEFDALKKNPSAYTPDDVEGLVDEVRSAMRAERNAKR